MSATLEQQMTWPTIEEADGFANALVAAYNAVDEMLVRCHRLIDQDDVWEKPDGVQAPTLAEIGAVTRMTSALRFFLENDVGHIRDEWAPKLEQLLASASTFEAYSRGKRT